MMDLKISFLNVGHGEFCYCETPYGQSMIIDCGSGSVTPSHFLSKIDIIDELQISHPHTDHFDDIEEISKKDIRSFRCPNPNSFEDKTIGWKKNDQSKIKKVRELYKHVKPNNTAIKSDSTFSHLVWKPSTFNKTDPNTASLITSLSYGNQQILMAGDLLKSGWEEMLKDDSFRRAIKGTTILKASHHGRENGYCPELFNCISPKICIISDKSLEKDNKNTSVTNKYTEALKKNGGGIEFTRISDGTSVGIRYVLTTRNDGSICVKVQNNSWEIRTQTQWMD